MATAARLEWREKSVAVGDDTLLVLRAGKGKPLLVLHEELGFPGTQKWQARLAARRKLIAPQHPGFGRGPAIEWLASVRDLACVYARWLRESELAPIEVIGFSLGAWIAAEMAAGDPALFSRMVLVSPLGIRPDEGEILDMFMLTSAQYLRATVRDPEGTAEYTVLYGAEQTPETYAAFEEARAQIARLAWKPYCYNPSLPHLLGALNGLETLIICGADDAIAPPSIARAYAAALDNARLVELPDCGHRPEIEQRKTFVKELGAFLG